MQARICTLLGQEGSARMIPRNAGSKPTPPDPTRRENGRTIPRKRNPDACKGTADDAYSRGTVFNSTLDPPK